MEPVAGISKRLIEVRKALGFTPADFALKIGKSRPYVANMEAGRREVPLETVMFLAGTLGVAPDYILLGRGPMFQSDVRAAAGANQSTNLSANLSPVSKTKRTKNEDAPQVKERILVVTQDTSNNVTFPVISPRAAANYLSGYQTQEYFENLASVQLPRLLVGPRSHGVVMQIQGDSMETKFKDGDYVACVRVEPHEWAQIRDLDCYIVVSETYGIQFKRIKNRINELGFIRCKSDNRRHHPYNIQAEDLLELWRFVLHLSSDASNPNEDLYKKVEWVEDTTTDLREMYEGMKEQIERMQLQLNQGATTPTAPDKA